MLEEFPSAGPVPRTWMVRDDLSTVLRTATRAAAGCRADAPYKKREELKECLIYSPKLKLRSSRMRAARLQLGGGCFHRDIQN